MVRVNSHGTLKTAYALSILTRMRYAQGLFVGGEVKRNTLRRRRGRIRRTKQMAFCLECYKLFYPTKRHPRICRNCVEDLWEAYNDSKER